MASHRPNLCKAAIKTFIELHLQPPLYAPTRRRKNPKINCLLNKEMNSKEQYRLKALDKRNSRHRTCERHSYERHSTSDDDDDDDEYVDSPLKRCIQLSELFTHMQV